MARVYARIPEKLFEKAKNRARERGLVKPSGKENISGYLRQLVREDANNEMRRVSKDFLEKMRKKEIDCLDNDGVENIANSMKEA